MQITRQAEYAVRLMMELAKAPAGKFISSGAVSAAQGLPEKFLTKTVQVLARAGLVETRRGMQGGIRLTAAPESITIADILQAVEGKPALNPCLAEDYLCPHQPDCRVQPVLRRAQAALIRELSKETIAELAAAGKERARVPG